MAVQIKCLICYEIFTESCDLRVVACGHVFHFNCLRSWLDRSKTCPECRYETNTHQLPKIFLNFIFNNEENETLRFDLETSNTALSLLKTELKTAQDELNLANQYKYELDLKTRDYKIIEQEMELERNKFKLGYLEYMTSQNEIDLKKKKNSSDSENNILNDTIKSLKQKLETMKSELKNTRLTVVNQAESLKTITNICYEFISAKDKCSADSISKTFIETILNNKDFVQKALDNKTLIENTFLNKKNEKKTFVYYRKKNGRMQNNINKNIANNTDKKMVSDLNNSETRIAHQSTEKQKVLDEFQSSNKNGYLANNQYKNRNYNTVKFRKEDDIIYNGYQNPRRHYQTRRPNYNKNKESD